MYIGYIRSGEFITPECRRTTDLRQVERLTDLVNGMNNHYGIDDIVCFRDDGFKQSRAWLVWRLVQLAGVAIEDLRTVSDNDELHHGCIDFQTALNAITALLTLENPLNE